MWQKTKVVVFVLLIYFGFFLSACSKISPQSELNPSGLITQTSVNFPALTPVQNQEIHNSLPTQTPMITSDTSEVIISTSGPANRVEIFSHDYAAEGEAVYNAFVTRDGRYLLITLYDYFAEIVDLNSMFRIKVRLGCELLWPDVIAIDPQGNSLMLCMDYSNGEEFQIWRLDSGSIEAEMISSVQSDPLLTTTAAAFSPDGKYFALGLQNGEVNIYKSSNGNLHKQIEAHIDNVTSLAFSPDSKYLLTDSWSFDLETYVFAVQTGEKIATLITEGVGSPNEQTVWFSPDGSLAAGMSTSGLEVFSTSAWEHLYSLPYRYRGWLGCNNKTWFDASNSSQVDIYMLSTGELLLTVPTFQLFCLEDQRAAIVEIKGDQVTLYAFPLD